MFSQIYLYKTLLFVFIFAFPFCVKSLQSSNSDDSLLMVQVLFRHGERTTDSFYPNDPYINHTFYPIGTGGLTNRGKNQEYQLGQFLRRRYNKFLGHVYTNDIMKVRSTGFTRTRMSALLVAAGLWPPNNPQIWNSDLQWLPIPVDYKPYEQDDLLNPGACLKRSKTLMAQSNIKEIQEQYIAKYKSLMEYLERHSGKNVRNPMDISELYLILKTEEDGNLTLPLWTKSVYPEPLHEAASIVYKFFNHNPEIKKINAGYFLKKILNDFKNKISNLMEENLAKIYLYSGHESTLGHILDALNVQPHVSVYGSAILFELHKIEAENSNYIKILYKRRSDQPVLEEIMLSGYNISTYEKAIEDIIPTVSYSEACKIYDN